MDSLLVVLVTFPSEESVRQIGTALVEKQLIACINYVPKIGSIYQWEGKVCDEQETLGIMKTTSSRYAKLEAEIQLLHPYDVPEIIALDSKKVSDSYLQWVIQSVQ